MYYRRNVLNTRQHKQKNRSTLSWWWPRLLLLFILLGSIAALYLLKVRQVHNNSSSSVTAPSNTNKIKDTEYSHAKRAVEDLSDKIFQRFQFHDESLRQFFLISWNIPAQGHDILKYKIAKKMVDGHSSAQFLMVFSGTSVTAGYDNYFNESYPIVFEKRMRPIFEALGIKLIVRNIAQRRISCHMSNFCLEAMGGPDADFYGWENSYRY
jgi:hypothetical protein